MSEISDTAMFGRFAPKYVQVAMSLIDDISSGRLKCGDRLESQNELARRFGITPVTARKALDVLKDRGLATAKGGKGTFLASCEVSETVGKEPVRVGYVRAGEVNISDGVYMQIMDGAFSALHGHDVDIVYFNEKQLQTSSLETLANFSKRVDGLIVPGTLPDDVFSKLVDLNIKLVAIQVKPGLRRIPYVGPDYSDAAYKATRHLIELGHRCLGTIGYLPDFIHTKQFRHGYEQALDEFGVQRQERFEFWEHDQEGGGYFTAQKMFADPMDRPTGVICMTEHKARLAVRYLASIGLRVPEDVSVIGQYDGVESICEPPFLTTIRHDSAEVGKQAAEMLLNIIRGNGNLRIDRKELRPTLIERNTTVQYSEDLSELTNSK